MHSRKLRAAPFALTVAFLASTLAAAEKPALVVILSVDQMRADYLERFQPWFGKDGLRRFLERGAVFPQARYRHAVTFTGPGHASIGTGLDPRHHGIIGNNWLEPQGEGQVYCVEDHAVSFVGGPAGERKPPWSAASPHRLNGVSLGDRLKERFPDSRVVGIALKDRSAVLMAGRKADAALWFEDRWSRFVTSTYYRPQPALLRFNETAAAFLADRAHATWNLSGRIPRTDLDRITFDPPELFGSKAAPKAYGSTFPHSLTTPREIVSSPWGDELVLALARDVVHEMKLGSHRDVPDLLFVGLSSTDYYGHWFGPDSKEIAEGIVRLDGALETFFQWLDREVGSDRALIFLTGDHGVTPIPEVARAKARRRTGRDDPSLAGRVDLKGGSGPAAAVSEGSPHRLALERRLAQIFAYELDEKAPAAQEGAIVLFEEPSLYLNKPALARRRVPVERAKEAVRDFVRGLPGVLSAYTNTEIGDGLQPAAPYALAIERSFRADRSGDVFVVLKPGWMWSYGKEAGTTHGQPGDDDGRVPLLAWGAGVLAGSWDAKVSPLDIARSVGAIYGIEVGEPDAAVLEPVLGKAMGTKRVAAASR